MTTLTEPSGPTSTPAALDAAERVLRPALATGRPLAVLTGAGVSTDSGIPDYRGEGTPRRTPMTVQTFLADPSARQRYWAGSQLGWERFMSVSPNAGHRALAELEQRGVVGGLVTQNVDGLHRRAGSRHVVDLHGSMDRARCVACGQGYARSDLAARIHADNPWLAGITERELGPDGDVETERYGGLAVPDCAVCGGLLKPDVVFFGEYVPVERFRAAETIVHRASALLVAGSSLAVNSGIRLLERARRRRLPIVIVNRGATKGDGRSALKIDGGTSEILAGLAERLSA